MAFDRYFSQLTDITRRIEDNIGNWNEVHYQKYQAAKVLTDASLDMSLSRNELWRIGHLVKRIEQAENLRAPRADHYTERFA